MGFNDLLVHVDATANGQTRVQIAAQLAVRHRSHVTGFFVRKPPTTSLDLTFFADSDLEVPLYQRHLQRIGADDEAKLRQSREVFETELAREKIDGDWLVVDGSPAAAIEASARFAELVIVGQESPDGAPPSENFAAELALACGRPVLAIPQSVSTGEFGNRILIAWSGSRESARAVGDAMPLLKRAAFVALVAVQQPWESIETGMEELAKLERHLAHCQVKAERYVVQAPEHAAGDEILARAEHASCDLIVMGVYGHSRLREIVLGGASRTVLKSTSLPVLLSH